MPEDYYLSFIPEIARNVQQRAAAAGVLMRQLEDYEHAHLTLDMIGVPRVLEPGGAELSLANRVVYLNGMLESAKLVLDRMKLDKPEEFRVVYKVQRNGRGLR